MRDQRPGKFVVSEILGHRDGEDAPLAARQKVRGLALVRTAGLDAVIWTNGDVEFFFQIPIEVPDQQTEAAVVSLEPSFEGAGHGLTGFVGRLRRQRSPRE